MGTLSSTSARSLRERQAYRWLCSSSARGSQHVQGTRGTHNSEDDVVGGNHGGSGSVPNLWLCSKRNELTPPTLRSASTQRPPDRLALAACADITPVLASAPRRPSRPRGISLGHCPRSRRARVHATTSACSRYVCGLHQCRLPLLLAAPWTSWPVVEARVGYMRSIKSAFRACEGSTRVAGNAVLDTRGRFPTVTCWWDRSARE